ncbi:MAG: hypothetical protein WCF31_09330, partial [Candidatus Deferrimicrobiaceae bacterium]
KAGNWDTILFRLFDRTYRAKTPQRRTGHPPATKDQKISLVETMVLRAAMPPAARRITRTCPGAKDRNSSRRILDVDSEVLSKRDRRKGARVRMRKQDKDAAPPMKREYSVKVMPMGYPRR